MEAKEYFASAKELSILWCKHKNNVVESVQCDVAQVLCEWLSQPEDRENSAKKKKTIRIAKRFIHPLTKSLSGSAFQSRFICVQKLYFRLNFAFSQTGYGNAERIYLHENCVPVTLLVCLFVKLACFLCVFCAPSHSK